MVEQVSMRKKWFEHVDKTRKKLQRKDKGTTHRAAMKAASVTWPQEKVKGLSQRAADLGTDFERAF